MNNIKKLLFLLLALAFIFPIISLTGCEPSGYRLAIKHCNQAIDLNAAGKYDEAIAECNKAIELDPTYANTYLTRGYAYIQKGQYDLAIADFTKAIQLDPKDSLAYSNRGYTYIQKGQYDLAIADLTIGIQLDPKNALNYYNRAAAYSNEGEYDLAIADYTVFIQLSDDDEMIQYANEQLAKLGQSSAPAKFTGIGGKSKYDGVFTGMFTYWYREYTTDAQGKKVFGAWIPKAMNVRFTFQSLASDEMVRASGSPFTLLQITNVWVSDPAFGTGLTGITPISSSVASLPLDPTGATPSPESTGIIVEFPNGVLLTTNTVAGALKVVGEIIISVSSSLNPAIQDYTWFVNMPNEFNSVFAHGKHVEILYKKWEITGPN